MKSPIVALRVGGTVFGIMCLGQLTRLLVFPRLEVLAAGHRMPLWPSAVAALVLGGLSFWMWKATYVADKDRHASGQREAS
jgi:hypothetical protein